MIELNRYSQTTIFLRFYNAVFRGANNRDMDFFFFCLSAYFDIINQDMLSNLATLEL